PEACAVIETAPGEEAQVDYGSGPLVRDSGSGKYRRTRLFVLTLGYSRKAVRLLGFGSSSRIWAELHEKAFRRLGGVTRLVVFDYVPGNIIKVLWRAALCDCGAQSPRWSRGKEWMMEHNSHSESSHFKRSGSLRHPAAGRHSAEASTGGRHAATAA